ncbi:MAG: ribosome silencing factor [Pseudomonadales bacterium]
MTPETLRDLVITALEDKKGREITSLNVSKTSGITDFMVIVSGTSDRHVKALVDSVVEAASRAGQKPIGVEGRETYEWVLVDLGDVLVHVMQTETRAFYDLERLWSDLPADSEAGV